MLDKTMHKDVIVAWLKFLYKRTDKEMGYDSYVRRRLMHLKQLYAVFHIYIQLLDNWKRLVAVEQPAVPWCKGVLYDENMQNTLPDCRSSAVLHRIVYNL